MYTVLTMPIYAAMHAPYTHTARTAPYPHCLRFVDLPGCMWSSIYVVHTKSDFSTPPLCADASTLASPIWSSTIFSSKLASAITRQIAMNFAEMCPSMWGIQ